MRTTWKLLLRGARRRRSERGASAVLMAVVVASLMIPLCAISIDISRWWVEAERVQAAADAAATGAVTHMPDNFDQARARALELAAMNGFAHGVNDVTVTVGRADTPTKLKVTVSSGVKNQFGKLFGVGETAIARSAVADFNAPAPMGSPCNAFANEPPGSALQGPRVSVIKPSTPAECTSNPQFWASISGPEVAKDQGSQFEARKCWGGEDECSGNNQGATNKEFEPRGYIYLVRVSQEAVGHEVDLQIYDPETVPGRSTCQYAPTSAIQSNNPNYHVDDGYARYARSTGTFCTGDDDSSSRRFGSEEPTVTSFGLRGPVDNLNPFEAPPITHCAKQFGGYKFQHVTRQRLTRGQSGYDDSLARHFHQWVSLCKFTPTQAGDHYLQVRTNVAMGNPTKVFTQQGDDPSVKGNSINSFALRANSSAPAGAVTVAAYERMRIFANANSATTTFNLVRVIPAAATKSLVVSFFDVGEGASSGSVQLLPPKEARLNGVSMTSVSGCTGEGPRSGNLSNCRITNITPTAFNGKIQHVRVPIPAGYTCEVSNAGGCWWRATVSFGTGSVNDATTWTAQVGGDPVRLIE